MTSQKSTRYITIGIIVLLVIAVVVVLFASMGIRCPKACTVDYLQEMFGRTGSRDYTIFSGSVKTKLKGSEIADVLMFDEWNRISSAPSGEEPLLVIRLQEEHEIRIYEDYICVYYGYVGIGEATNVYYSIPNSTVAAIVERLRASS